MKETRHRYVRYSSHPCNDKPIYTGTVLAASVSNNTNFIQNKSYFKSVDFFRNSADNFGKLTCNTTNSRNIRKLRKRNSNQVFEINCLSFYFVGHGLFCLQT